MKTLDQQMAVYAAYHRNRWNRLTHFIGVPAIIFAILKAFGVIANLQKLIGDLSSSPYTISGGRIFRWLFLFGLLGAVVASAVTVFLAFLYNLIADVVGGIELLVTERE